MKKISVFLLIASILLFSSLAVKAFQKWVFQPLDGVSIVIDAGHGGKDQGAGVNGISEANLNLAIAKEVADLLTEHGAIVTMTRIKDNDLAGENSTSRKKEDMKKRVQIINDEKSDLFLSLHLNTYPSSQVSGAQVFYGAQTQSMELAQSIQNQFESYLHCKKTIRQGDYYLLNEARIPGVLIECGFLSNPREWSQLQETAYQKKLAGAICAGVLNFLEAHLYE